MRYFTTIGTHMSKIDKSFGSFLSCRQHMRSLCIESDQNYHNMITRLNMEAKTLKKNPLLLANIRILAA